MSYGYNGKVRSSRFYGEYHGHKVRDLETLYPALRASCDSLIWTAGDSSLDNKYWFRDHRPSVGAHASVLEPPISNADITYWLNYLCEERVPVLANYTSNNPTKRAAINTAVEATTLNERSFRLRPQDIFLRDNIRESDVLVVSVGGNDVALAPLPCTILSILSLTCLPSSCIERSCVATKVPVDDCCCGCGASLLSCGGACPPCLGYMAHLFGTRVEKYIERLTAKNKPKKILVCMIYYLDERTTPGSWAGPALSVLGYNDNPEKLQLVIRKLFTEATCKISIPGTEVIPVPLFNALDGKTPNDYVARVEPSSQGGRKVAEYLLDVIEGRSPSQHYGSVLPATSQPIESQYMGGR